jgi:RHS repeat-associated protein
MSRLMRVITGLVFISFVIQAILPIGYSHGTENVFVQSAFGQSEGKSFNVPPGRASRLDHEGATLEIPAGSVSRDTIITIIPLEEEEMPLLDQGMTDVTLGPRRGYRLLPHNMKFNKKITVKLPYDPSLIPDGLTEQDLKTYYFDDQKGVWQELELVSIDTRRQVVVSLSDHFTDMINATITVPDHPQTMSYNPNSIKDIKAADPGAGINLIEPPKASSKGETQLFYPIEVPPGRADMRPEMVLSYNSNHPNGWLGIGWDLPVSAISIDTRWGVPRYHFDDDPNNPSYETETYLLEGAQLAPVAHRGPLQPRTAEKQFHTRVEGQFRKIIRHGDRPSNYWWEVVDKEGKRFFYGGSPQGGVLDDAVLSNPGEPENIFRWMLREVRDTNGNTVRYDYDVVEGADGGEPWRQIYLKSIRYTGSGNDDGPYELLFNRELGRPDVIVDGLPGFKSVLDQLLTSIDVRLTGEANPLIRRYRLEYETGQFNKTRLARVIQFGEDGTTEFNRHSFEYFDEVAGDPAQPYELDGFRTTPGFGGATVVDGELLLFDQESTALGGTSGSSDQTHLYLGFSTLGYQKEASVGVKVGVETTDSTTLLTLIDLNGDGLLDQVYQSGNDVYFRANTGGPQSAPNFAPNAVNIEGISELGFEASTTFTIGAETYALGASIFADIAFTRSRGDSYLSDINGDGLLDFVYRGSVYFNTLMNGVPTFGPVSPTPLVQGAPTDTSGMVQDPDAGREDMEAQYHLVDPLRRWIAPYAGEVSITGQVGLLNAPPDTYTTADGVRLSIQHNENEIWSITLDDPTDTIAQPIQGLDQVPVNAGDRIYFRVNSINDGAFDAVDFDATIMYSELASPPPGGLDTDQVDENNMPQFVYNAAADFAFGGRALPFIVPFDGTATLVGTIDKSAVTSDDVSLEVIQNGAVVHSQTLTWDQTGTVGVDVPLVLAAENELLVHLYADSRVDLTNVQFVPGSNCQLPGKGPAPLCIAYTSIEGEPAPVDQDGNHLLVFTPPVTAQIYPRNAFSTPYSPVTIQLGEGGGLPGTCEDGIDNDNNDLTDLDDPTCRTTISVSWSATADLFYDLPISGDFTTLNYNMTLSVKRPGEHLAKLRLEVRDGVIVDPATPTLNAQFEVASGNRLYFVIDADATDGSTLVLNELALLPVSVGNPQGSEGPGGPGSCSDGVDNNGDGLIDLADPQCQLSPGGVPVDVHLGLTTYEAFGGGFRGWGYGQYNGEETTQPVDEARLRLPLDQDDEAADFFVPMVPFLDENRWRAEDEDSWIGAGQMSASRLMVDYLDFPTGDTFGGGQAVVTYGGGENIAVGGGVGFEVLSFGGGVSEGTNWSDIDFTDFNGDGYPDVIGAGQVQTTLPNGALEAERIPVGGFERVRENENENTNVSLGATLSRATFTSRGRVRGITNEQAAYNLSGSLGQTGNEGTSTARWDLVDINGDGLPDYVRRPNLEAGETELVVRLNLGYRFGAEEIWANASSLRFERSLGVGLSTGIGFTLPAYSFGGGFSHTLSMAAAELDLIDVNGDGLVDLVIKDVQLITTTPGLLESPTTMLSVRFNTGDGFTDQVYTYNGAMPRPLRANATVSRNLGLHFTVPIPIPFTTASVIINPGYNHGNNLGGFEVMLSDLDGDGYADHIYSDTNGNVAVNLNNHGRTNLLKTVHRPLGATIELDYARSGNTPDHPGNQWVLNRTMVSDGFLGDGADQIITTYQYAGGKHDRAEREFYGFRTVTEEHRNGNELYRSIVKDFHNDSFYTQGLLEREVTQDAAGNKFLETVNEYEVVTVAAGIPGLEDFTDIRVPQMSRTERNFYEGNTNPGKSTFLTYEYDAFGNTTQFFDAGDAGAQDDVLATLEYSQCPASYIIGIPTKIVVSGGGSLMRQREATIDCNTGNLTQVRAYLENGTVAHTNLDYFENGNLKKVTAPENLNGLHPELEYEYDGTVQTHITEIEDNLGYESSATYHLKYGQVATTTDLNGNLVSNTYDQFGRLVSVTGPYEQGGPTPTIRFEFHPEAAVPWALTKHLDSFRDPSGNDTIDTVIFTDGLKRVLQTKKDAAIFVEPGTPADQEQMIVSGRVFFDFLGRVVEERYPRTEPRGNAGVFNPEVDPVPPTVSEFDVLDRTTRITIPDNTTTLIAYAFGADRTGTIQFETTTTDANGNQKQTYRNVREQVTSVKEFYTPDGGATQVLWTSYAYDPLKQLVEVVDAAGNMTSISYDNLGRRTVLDNPDTGRTETVYDLASNPVALITANLRAQGQQISYDYDALNRLTSITYPNFPENNVAYTYGPPGAGENRAGRITLVQDQAGSEELFYGKLGEMIREVRTVVGFTGAAPATYTTEYVFDTFGRLQSLTYPDGEVLTYRYDSGGLLQQATGLKGPNTYPYIQRLEYDKFEQRAFLEVGNGVQTQYTYDPLNRRLANLNAGLDAASPFQNLGYTYDNVGNVLELNNEVPVPAPPVFGGPVTQAFVYDDLYRLVGASGTYEYAPGKTNQYNLSQEYDHIHNIVSKQQTNDIVQPSGRLIRQQKTSYSFEYAYDGPQPHAATHIDNRTFTYDANGNQTGWTHDLNGTRRTIVWDDENRIQSVFDNGHQKAYKYDDQGERVLKRGPQGETAYVNQYFVIRNRQIGSKHIYAGETRLVSKLMMQNQDVLEKDQYFYHPDHLGSSNYVTDADGKLYEHIQYFPFGETWVLEASNTQRTPYLFTSKELDEETGLYYFGARYFDPRTSLWQSPDPELSRYLPERDFQHTQRAMTPSGVPQPLADELSSLGGVYNTLNLNLYGYAHQNPLLFVDPDGRKIVFAEDASPKFKKQIKQMVAYLRKGGAADVWDQLEKREEIITIREGKSAGYTPSTKTISINPLQGLMIPVDDREEQLKEVRKVIQSPAIGLVHELGHALLDIMFPERSRREADMMLDDFGGSADEMRVLKEFENPAAKKLKEPVRSTYGGTPVDVACPTCNR